MYEKGRGLTFYKKSFFFFTSKAILFGDQDAILFSIRIYGISAKKGRVKKSLYFG
jgi:hypothetical protein